VSLTPEVARRKENAVEEVTVRRIRADRKQWKCSRHLYGTTHCPSLAIFLVETSSKDYAYCWGCIMFALKDILLAPDEEYVDEAREQFDRSARTARIAAHSGCTGHSEKEPDGICRRPVIATCTGQRQYYRATIGATDKTCGPKCSLHAVRCRKRHGLSEVQSNG
jgi:Pyruvate/2-oxoacid:ferredoxin oxidoreductase delta subunit